MPNPRRPNYLRRRIGVFGSVAVILGAAFYLALTLLAPITPAVAVAARYSTPTSAAPIISMPGYGASAISAIGFDGPLAEGGTRSPLPIASITKIVTTLVVLQAKPLALGKAGPGILFTAQDAAIRAQYVARGGEVAPIAVGQTMSERDVITVGLVASANNYERALADWAFGSERAFLPVANAWLTSHGMTSTVLTDCTGLNSATRSTATDLIKLGKLALQNPVVAHAVAIRHTTVPVVGAIDNTNTVLGISGIIGIKTGTLNTAGSSLLFASTFTIGGRTITLVGVILDGPSHPVIDKRIRGLIGTARRGFVNLTLARAGQPFASYSTPWGGSSTAAATKDASVVVWAGTPVGSSIAAAPVGTAARGTVVGAARFVVDGKTYSVPLALTRSIADPGPWWRITHPGELS